MKPEEQRIAIAEACGKKWVKAPDGWYDGPMGDEGLSYESMLRRLPDYLNDLNAMHEALAILDVNQWAIYCEHLLVVTGASALNWRVVLEAAPRHKAEAFLRTIGKWDATQQGAGEGKA